jgi:hypothetical protein
VRLAAAALLLLADLGAFTWLAGQARRRPLALSGAVGLGLLVAWQAVAVSMLSVVHAVTGTGLAVTACLPPLLAVAVASQGAGRLAAAVRRAARSARWMLVAYGWIPAIVLPLGAVLVAVAASYAPNNWDSMTYRLARVAHWIQHASANPYDTNVFRQVALSPGSEYLLLALQAISGSDRLANGIQLGAWILLVLSAPSMARLAGAPRRVASWAGPIVAGTPMLVLQATSTQNDLVASAMTIALGAACLPFLHPRARARPADVALLGTLAGAAFLVKATAISSAAPLLVLAVPGGIRALRHGPPGRAAGAAGLAVAGAVAVAGPYAVRMALFGARVRELAAPFAFPLLGEWGARAESLRIGLGRHLPPSSELWAGPAAWFAALPPFHEDLAANPLQSAFAIASLALLVACWRRVPRRARWAGVVALASWGLFQVSFRPNEWVSRLESPLFALLPLTMGSWAAIRRPRLRAAAAGTLGLAAVALGLVAAFLNPSRPAGGVIAPRDAVADYYANRPSQRPAHDAALDAAARTGCGRIGLLIGEDSYDYPLTWRAMERGLEVRHVLGPDPWPCVIVSDRGLPPEGKVERRGPWWPVLLLSPRNDPAKVVGGVWVRQ